MNQLPSSRQSSRPMFLVRWGVAFLVSFLAASGATAQPTVNGLFYGDGDDALYSPYATSQNGSVLYSYYDAGTTSLYVALVVSHAVNDMVCSPSSNRPYTQSVGWNPPRSCNRATDSEFATFTFQCAPGSPNSWTWQQALGCSQTAGPPESSWVSDSSCGPSSVASAWPPGVEANATTSWVANANTYQAAAPATRAWDLYTFGTGTSSWKSPFVAATPNDATLVPGYPTYSTTDGGGLFYEWEWSMVYEWSVDLGPTGTNCGNAEIVFISGLSHHSPGKHGGENDPFDPPANPTFADWGDNPDSYGTTDANNGAQHHIRVDGPYLGSDISPELDGQPTADATGDGLEEDGVTANVTSNWTAGSTQSIDIVISNAPGGGATFGAWFDWNGDGDFDDAGEFFQFSGLADGTHTLSIVVGAGFDWSSDELFTRFRLFSSAAVAPSGGATLVQSDSAGTATDGEVEDYRFSPGTLPVTLNAFVAELTPAGEVAVRWQTASETDNIAFEVRGLIEGSWHTLTGLVESNVTNSALPQTYEIRVADRKGLAAIELLDYDSRGRTERFGPFAIGGSYGQFQPEQRVDWSGPRAEREARLAERGFSDTSRARASSRWKKLRSDALLSKRDGGDRFHVPLDSRAHGRGLPHGLQQPHRVEVTSGSSTHVAVTETGIQRITYETLRDGGLDLAGVRGRDIAVTWRGQPVARWVPQNQPFAPGSAIDFIGRAPTGDDALYIDANLYQISVDRSRARAARHSGRGVAQDTSAWHLKEEWVDRQSRYYHQSPTGDPWVDQVALARPGSPAMVTLDLPVEGPVADGPGELILELGTITDLPDLTGPGGKVLPEHTVEVWLIQPDGSRVYVTTSSTSGQRDWTIETELPRESLEPGLHRVELSFSTEYLFSLVVVDRLGLRYAAPYRGPSVDFAPDPSAPGYRIEGFSTPSVAAYAEGNDGELTLLAPRTGEVGGKWWAAWRKVKAERYWVTEAPSTPQVFTTDAPPDLLAEPADLVVVAGSSFVGSQALQAYLDARSHLDPLVVDIEDIYNAVGFGMALPSAVTDYLAARDAIHPFTHVQLVGTDCYDRLGYVSACLSHIPLPTARVGVSFYSPSQNRLVDLDGDGVGDKAVAQFSVRDTEELSIIVRKAADWDLSGLSAAGSALLIAEESDGSHDFDAQLDRLRAQMDWSETDLIRLADHPSIETAQDALKSALDTGRSLTTFSGHSSPTVWAFRGLLTASNVTELTNSGRPTIMVPLACETTYDISPNANVLGHQLLFGGDQGALAISGAVSLANLSHNELMATHVIQGLESGLTLGEAVLAGRQALGTAYQELQDNWLTQGDVAAGLQP